MVPGEKRGWWPNTMTLSLNSLHDFRKVFVNHSSCAPPIFPVVFHVAPETHRDQEWLELISREESVQGARHSSSLLPMQDVFTTAHPLHFHTITFRCRRVRRHCSGCGCGCVLSIFSRLLWICETCSTSQVALCPEYRLWWIAHQLAARKNKRY